MSLLKNLGGLLQNGITLVAMMAMFLPYGLWLPLALVVSTLPALYVVARYNRREHRRWLRTTGEQRLTWYHDWLLTAREVAAELRLFGLGDHFQTVYQTLRQRLREQRLALIRNQTLGRVGAGPAALLVAGAVLAWMVWLAL